MKRTRRQWRFGCGIFASVLVLVAATPARAIVTDVGGAQGDYEREVGSVVRNKRFYKASKFEISADAGVMPYDSVYNTYQLGGRLTWHIADHYGWEILDAQMVFSSVSGFTTGLVSGSNGPGQIADLESVMPKMFLSSNFLLSPVYGKVRFFGAQVIYFDMYTLLGLGAAKTETHSFSSTSGGGVSDSVVHSGMDPMVDVGLGFKIFLTNGIGFDIDLRDYIAFSQNYRATSPKNNFVVTLGLSFFLPTFG
jgi:outer membrane beta-barrel protein